MSPLERISLPLTKLYDRSMDKHSSVIVASLQTAAMHDERKNLQFLVGSAPLFLASERYVTSINERVMRGLGSVGLSEVFAYDETLTRFLCSDDEVTDFDHWPTETKSDLSIAYKRLGNPSD